MNIDNGPFAVPGFRLGHWTHESGQTGCTVIIAEKLVPAAVEVRGGAPGTRETNLLDASCTVQGIDAVLLTGGSAFGLAAADGVMNWLREHGRGFPTSSIPVPIVSGAVIFDLIGDYPVWPASESGYVAALSSGEQWRSGRFGAGSGARVSKGLGRTNSVAAGLGVAQIAVAAGTISAIFAVNAVGDISDDETGDLITRPAGGDESTESAFLQRPSTSSAGENTIIGAVICDRALDHHALTRLTIAAHSGLSKVVRPAHMPSDGDTVFALSASRGSVSGADLTQLSVACQLVSQRAIVNSVRHSAPSE